MNELKQEALRLALEIHRLSSAEARGQATAEAVLETAKKFAEFLKADAA